MLKRHRKATALIALSLLGLSACSSGSQEAADGKTVVKIGTTEESQPYWKPLKELAAKNDITIETVNFTDYTQPNPALSQKQTDLNLFQHLAFLANYNAKANDTLTPVGSTQVVPLGVYSQKHKDVAGIPAGGKVAIPNDPTNQARALLVLQEAGLVKLKDGGSILSTPADIESGSKVEVTPVDAAQTPASLASVDAAVINNTYLTDAGIDPASAIFKDDPNKSAAEPYINVIVARAEDKDNEAYKKVVELYHDPAVVKEVAAASKDTSVEVTKSPEDLRKILDGLEETVKKTP